MTKKRADQTGPLPQFAIDGLDPAFGGSLSDADRTLEYHGRAVSVFEAIEDVPETLSPVVSPQVLGADASLEFPHPLTPELLADDSVELYQPTLQVRAVRGNPVTKLAIFSVCLTLAAMLFGAGLARTAPVSGAPAVEMPSPPPKVAAPVETATVSMPDPTPYVALPPAPSTGIVDTRRIPNTRIYVDGKPVGSTPGAIVECGAHVVRLGPRGRAHAVTVPCGGIVSVD